MVSEYERGKGTGFERIRRITGYISGSLNTWGSAKRAEERDRVKHIMESSGTDENMNTSLKITFCAMPETVKA